MRLLLASGSPRRKEILTALGYEVTVVKPTFDEAQVTEPDPARLVMRLAEGKGRSVPAGDSLLVASDTVVVFEGEVLGKPSDEKEAAAMLRRLSGKTHRVYTGVYLQRGAKSTAFCDCTEVVFRTLTEEEIAAYIATGSPMDKAGAYGVQDSGFAAELRGSFHTVMGFPAERFEEIIKDFGKE